MPILYILILLIICKLYFNNNIENIEKYETDDCKNIQTYLQTLYNSNYYDKKTNKFKKDGYKNWFDKNKNDKKFITFFKDYQPSNHVKTTSKDPYKHRKGPSASWSTPTKKTYTLDGLSKLNNNEYLDEYSNFGLINFDQQTIKKNMYLDKPCSQPMPKEDLLKDGYCNIFKDKSLDGHKNDKELNNLLWEVCPKTGYNRLCNNMVDNEENEDLHKYTKTIYPIKICGEEIDKTDIEGINLDNPNGKEIKKPYPSDRADY